jgi:N-acetyl-anhydromuramyl-L-alanine amidase AmpD
MLDIVKNNKFSPSGKQKKKNQIILIHTGREYDSYINSLTYRFNGNYNKIPNYIITRNGDIIQLLNNIEHSNIFDSPNINRNGIIISLENLGWLNKEPLKDYYINWIGDIYKGKVYEKKWRDYFFWEPYTEIQTEKTIELCKKIFSEMSIKPQFIGHNTKINGIEKYEGVVSRSNYDIMYTDINPSFNFEYFLKKLENEEYT